MTKRRVLAAFLTSVALIGLGVLIAAVGCAEGVACLRDREADQLALSWASAVMVSGVLTMFALVLIPVMVTTVGKPMLDYRKLKQGARYPTDIVFEVLNISDWKRK